MRGDDVAMLHGALVSLGFKIPKDELGRAFFGKATREAVLDFQKKHGLEPTGIVDEKAARLLNKELEGHQKDFVVKGTVQHPNGKPFVGGMVRAFDRDLRREQTLGEARTDEQGQYEIAYKPERFCRAEKKSADLVVRVYGSGGKLLYEPGMNEVVFNAPTVAIVDIQLKIGDRRIESEYERLLQSIQPLLERLSIAELRENEEVQDITFLHREAGWSVDQLEHMVVAHRLSAISEVEPEFYYALLRENTLQKLDLAAALQTRFEISLRTEVKPLFYQIVSLDGESVRRAVTQAIRHGIVPEELEQRLDVILGRLARHASKARAYYRNERPRQFFKLIEKNLMTGKFTEAMRILEQDFQGDIPQLIDQLSKASAVLSDEDKAEAEVSLRLAEILAFDEDIINDVRRLQGIKKPEDVRKLAALNRADWKRVLTESAERIKQGGKPLRKDLIDLHASSLVRKMERRFPTTAFAAQLERDKKSRLPHRDVMLKVFNEHPDFDLATTNINLFFKSHEVASIARDNAAGAIESLKTVQRVFKLTSIYSKTAALLKAGINSAYSIYAMGEAQFINRFATKSPFTRSEARAVYQKATDVHMASVMLATNIKSMVSASAVNSLAGLSANKVEAVTKDFPNLKNLFQLTDLCQCEHCRSVYSPAAYLVDVLQFLKNRLVVDTTSTTPLSLKLAKDVLFERRPDIGDLDLSCENTDTTLPYIDIVCELLEELVKPDLGVAYSGSIAAGPVPLALLTLLQSNGHPFTDQAAVYGPDLHGNYVVRDRKVVCKITPKGVSGWVIKRLRQTHLSAEELGAAPEYQNDEAYQTLQASKYAFGLPFDLYHQECRAYFGQFDIRRADLMQALQEGGNPSGYEIAADALGIADEERQLIATPAPAKQHIYWNKPQPTVATDMQVVDTFLTKTGLTYEQLVVLLEQGFINPSGNIFIQHLDNTCDTAQKRIANLDTKALDRMHRFLRLWRRTGWGIATLNRVITYPRLGNGKLDDACMEKVGNLAALKEKLGLPIDEIGIFYGTIPAEGENSRYQQVFLNKAANGFVDEALLPENVAKNEVAPPATQKKLSDPQLKETLSLCLGMKPADLDRLLDFLGVSAVLSFESLAALYSANLLAKKLGLKTVEYLTLQSLTGIPVFDSPAHTLRFIDKSGKVKAAAIKVADLQYLLKHSAADLEARTIKEGSITAFLKGLQQELQQAFENTRSPYDDSRPADENKGYVKDLLAKLPNFTTPELSKFMTIVDNTWQDTTQTPAAFIDAKFNDPQLPDPFDPVAIDSIKQDQADLAIPAGDTELKTKKLIADVLSALSAYFFHQAKKSILARALMNTFKSSEALTASLLRSARLKMPASAGNKTLLELLGADDFIDPVKSPPELPDITAATFSHQYAAVRLYHKIAPFAASLPLRSDEVEWLLLRSAELGWMELDRLPYDTGMPPTSFAQWEAFEDGVCLIKAYPPIVNSDDLKHPFSFYTLLELVLQPGTDVDSVLSLLSRLAGWDEKVTKDVANHFGFSIADYRLPPTYLRLEKAVVLLRRLGLDKATALALVKPQLTADDARSLRLALKARYEDAQWLGTLKGIQDKLRNQKRDALVAYILAINPGLKSSTDLYEQLLIDVEMDACQPTSRIVQAHGTLQLFVQRCLMGLEPKAVADMKQDPLWEQWKWMKNYRVWEANRKVFLYPENWIEPELRDDKSFLFTNLETELAQNELSVRNVEDASIRYLEKLDEIALLEVVAVYYQAAIYTMHVFARTKGGDPAVYYHRRFEKERYWTPWEKVELEITGDHLLAFERNNRLYLAWPIFTEEAKEDQSIKTPNPSEIPAGGKEAEKTLKRWKLQLAISEYSGKKWLPKKVSKEALCSPDPNAGYYEILPKKEDFRFTVLDLTKLGQFFIACSYIDNGKKPWDINWAAKDSATMRYLGAFSLIGCKGYPEPVTSQAPFFTFRLLPEFKDTAFKNLRYREMNRDESDDLGIETIFNPSDFLPVLLKTPGIFKVTYPLQMSLIDLIMFWLANSKLGQATSGVVPMGMTMRPYVVPLGTFMPYFYEDNDREYVVIPGFYPRTTKDPRLTARTFSNILEFVQRALTLCLKYLPKLQGVTDPAPVLAELVKDTEYTWLTAELAAYIALLSGYGYQFKNFYHPLVCRLKTAIYRDGIPGLMKHDTQMQKTDFDFQAVYQPTWLTVVKPHPPYPLKDNYPIEDIDFEKDGSYASYNWELFFHLPFEIAVKLSRDQRFEEAMDWFHYIFNPMGAVEGDTPAKYWVTKPFYQYQIGDYVKQRIDSILYAIAQDPTGAGIADLAAAVAEWRAKPFKPHVIARSRPVAYQKAVLMKYIDNLVNWGDYLFRQDTMESVNQATQLYILAEKLLGPKPRTVPPVVEPPAETYNQLEPDIDLFGNALLQLENLIPDLALLPHGGAELPPPPITLASLYFCIPQNEQLLGIWNLVADRLFKIRHCQNIEGVERILALFAPPIDPGALVRAAAAGLDISEIISGLSAPLPYYRFRIMARKATEFAQEVRTLGNALMEALEKKDAEGLALLRSTHERRVLDAIKMLKEERIQEAKETLEALMRAKAVWEENRAFLLSWETMNSWERLAEDLRTTSKFLSETVSAGYLLASALKAIPKFILGAAGFGGTPTTDTETPDFGAVAQSAGDAALAIAGLLDKGATLAADKAYQQRRKEEQEHRRKLVDREIAHIEKQMAAQEICLDIARKDLDNHIIQIENAKAVDDYMRSKFTNRELYDWTIGQISTVYFQAYKLAFDVAKKAERCFDHELGSTSTFLGFTYWDSLKKGLGAADRLLYDINRMEVAYLDQNKREYEITKQVSLAMLDPLALIRLRGNGKCTINLPETLFDLDYSGHYMRRLKSVSLSIPCAAGPYTSVSCKLSLVSNKYRKTTALLQNGSNKEKYAETTGNDDRFVYNVGAIQSIATSHAQNDSGMFELDFRDERYLPFEGTGAISTWQVEMPATFRQFDYSTISDVIIQLRYTARDGGSTFKACIEGALLELLNEELLSENQTGLFKGFDIEHEFPSEWQSLKQTGSASLTLTDEHLPLFVRSHSPSVDSVAWLARVKSNPATFVMSLDGSAFNLNRSADLGNLCIGASNPVSLGTPFTLAATNTADIEELVLMVRYKING